FLRAKIMSLIAEANLSNMQPGNFRSTLISCIKQLVARHEAALCQMDRLIQKSEISLFERPEKVRILQTICMAYLPECLQYQVSFQRYLLEEALKALSDTAGILGQEITSQIISTTAQYLRKQTREGIEYVWTDEYRLIKHIFSDAEHDLIGSVIEDLWWTY